MTYHPENSNAARKALNQYQQLLNHPSVIPEQCYRMSDNYYLMVCFTNQVIALFIAQNYSMIPRFIERAMQQMQRFEAQPNTLAYQTLVKDYFALMLYFLEQLQQLECEWLVPATAEALRQRSLHPAPALSAALALQLLQRSDT